ncbi:Modification methylase BanI [compost metagenome]
MRYIELCAGMGGISEGLNHAGHECVGYAECDTECKKCKTYTQHMPHPSKKFHTICCECGTTKRQQTHECYQILHDPEERIWSAYDVRSVSDDDIRSLRRDRGPIQMLVAGFPCQAFSIAGKREGFGDEIRGTVFFEIVRFASILRPECILLENVTGLLNHDKGRTFETIIGTLDELGYVGEWQVHNSASYVPQNRERVFIVASLRGRSGRKIFPFGRENSNSIKVVGRLEGNHEQNSRVYGIDGLAPTLSTMQGGGQEPKVLVVGNTNPSGNGMNGQVYDAEGLAPTLTTNKGEGNKILVNISKTGVMEPIPVLTPDRIEK